MLMEGRRPEQAKREVITMMLHSIGKQQNPVKHGDSRVLSRRGFVANNKMLKLQEKMIT